MGTPSEEELKHALEFIDAKLALPPTEFEKWANELLDKAHGYHVGRRKRRR